MKYHQDELTAEYATELRDICTVFPYHANPRHNNEAVAVVANSISEFGFRQPIVVDEKGVIVCGHTRYKAAVKLGLNRVPVHVATGLSDEQIKALRIADNRCNEVARWDEIKLSDELKSLLEIDMTQFGFSQSEIDGLLAPGLKEGLTDPDDIPEPPDEAKTKPGDLWILGDHRLLCGDSSIVDQVDQLTNGLPVHLVDSDPPYNVRVEPRSKNAIEAGLSSFSLSDSASRNAGERSKTSGEATKRKLRPKDRPLENDFISDEAFDKLLRLWFGNMARVLVPGGSFYLWGGYANLGNYPPALTESGLYFSQSIVWDKQHPVLTRKDYMGAFELAFYGWKKGAGHNFYGPNNALDLWHVKKVNPHAMVHLTEKPVELAVRAIEYSSKQGDHVLDLFGGSGSTMIACEQTDRRAFLMEIDPLYCDVIVQRWEEFTGKSAERQS